MLRRKQSITRLDLKKPDVKILNRARHDTLFAGVVIPLTIVFYLFSPGSFTSISKASQLHEADSNTANYILANLNTNVPPSTTANTMFIDVDNPDFNGLSRLLQSKTQPWETFTIRKGDSLLKIFNRAKVNNIRDAILIANSPKGKIFATIRPGQSISIQKAKDGKFLQLRYQPNPLKTLTVNSEDDKKYSFNYTAREPEIRINHGQGTINYSLLATAKTSQLDPNIMYDFMSLFGWQVDFAKGIRKGDQFTIIYEEAYIDNEKINNGDIIAAEISVSGHKYQAIRYQYEDGSTAHYTPNGQNIKGAFLRTPLKFTYITSGFSKRRLHPIKKTWQSHKGVDYAAPAGTPILATADGHVKFAGNKAGYGKVVILSHGIKYATLYAHMSRFARDIKAGAQVKQGDVIGYVGSTGLATGPHLHYEFRVNGVHKNPLTVDLPKALPIEEQHKKQFLLSANLWKGELEYLGRRQTTQNELATN